MLLLLDRQNSTMYHTGMGKRPDLSARNRTNNPMKNKDTVEKMRASLTGRRIPEDVRLKMSKSRKNLLSKRPELVEVMLKGTESKYLSKVRGKGWRLARIGALERDKYTCRECGETNRRLLVVHHINYKGRNLEKQGDMDNRPSNLITWCQKCHNRFHRHKSKDYHQRMSKIAP